MNPLILLIFIFCFLLNGILVYYLFHQKKQLHRIESAAADRLRYIQTLIDIVYTYKHQPARLLEHLQQEMTIKKILNYHLVDDLREQDAPRVIKCRENDRLLYSLYRRGFSARELCVIFELNNINSVYVKYCRMNKKINPAKNADSEETESICTGNFLSRRNRVKKTG